MTNSKLYSLLGATWLFGACIGVLATLELHEAHNAVQVDTAIVSANEALAAKDINGAKYFLHTAIGRAPNNYLAFEIFGDILFIEERFDDSLDMYRKAIENTYKEQIGTLVEDHPPKGDRRRIERKLGAVTEAMNRRTDSPKIRA